MYTLRMADLKTARLNLRVAARDDNLFREAAALSDESISEFLVESGRERAERLLADRTEFVLDQASWDQLTAALDQPARALPQLKELFSRPRPE